MYKVLKSYGYLQENSVEEVAQSKVCSKYRKEFMHRELTKKKHSGISGSKERVQEWRN